MDKTHRAISDIIATGEDDTVTSTRKIRDQTMTGFDEATRQMFNMMNTEKNLRGYRNLVSSSEETTVGARQVSRVRVYQIICFTLLVLSAVLTYIYREHALIAVSTMAVTMVLAIVTVIVFASRSRLSGRGHRLDFARPV